MDHHPKKKNDLDFDKKSLTFGFVGGFMALCTIGFFILLGVVLNDGASPKTAKRAAAPTPTNVAEAAPTPSAGGGAVANVSIELTDGDYIKGDVDAPVTIVEYSDLDCPFCERFHPNVEQVLADNPGNVNWVYRHFPLRSIHPAAARKAEGAECAGELAGADGFWGFIDGAFAGEPVGTDTQMAELAGQFGVDAGAFQECLDSGLGADRVAEDERTGLQAGAQGTPYSVILGPNGESIPLSGALPPAQMQQVVDSLLQ